MDKMMKAGVAAVGVGVVHWVAHTYYPVWWPTLGTNMVMAVGATVVVAVFAVTYWYTAK